MAVLQLGAQRRGRAMALKSFGSGNLDLHAIARGDKVTPAIDHIVAVHATVAQDDAALRRRRGGCRCQCRASAQAPVAHDRLGGEAVPPAPPAARP